LQQLAITAELSFYHLEDSGNIDGDDIDVKP
jgi:hypothetical protein